MLTTTIRLPTHSPSFGGKDNYPVDREARDQHLKVFPGVREIAQPGSYVPGRCGHYLSTECGIRQFLDISTGLPTAEDTHQAVPPP